MEPPALASLKAIIYKFHLPNGVHVCRYGYGHGYGHGYGYGHSYGYYG